MPDREKLIKHFEHLLNDAKGNYQDFVDLTVDAGEEILAMLKEQDKIIQNILLEKANELNDKVTTLQIEAQNREIRRFLEQK